MDTKKLSPNFSEICIEYIKLNEQIENLKNSGQIVSEMRVPPIRLSLGKIFKECNLALYIAKNDFELYYNYEERIQFKQNLALFFSILDSDAFLQSVLIPLKSSNPNNYFRLNQYISDLNVLNSTISASMEQRGKLSFDNIKTDISPIEM